MVAETHLNIKVIRKFPIFSVSVSHCCRVREKFVGQFVRASIVQYLINVVFTCVYIPQ